MSQQKQKLAYNKVQDIASPQNEHWEYYYWYLLCSSRTTQGEYRVNTILKLSISDNMKNVCTYILPHDYYSAFCASDSCLFVAQTTRNCVIEKLRIDDDKK